MNLSERQQKILDFIRQYIEEHDYPPTIREIGQAVKISSTSVVNYNLDKLVEAGLLERTSDVSRGLRLRDGARVLEAAAGRRRGIPILGHIAAGQPITVFPESVDTADVLDLATDVVGRAEEVYALRVQGDSMIDALVDSGDLVILNYQKTANNGDMVAAWLTDREETTLKYFFLEGDRVRLQPANPNYEPIIVPADQVEIQGKVIAIIRRVG
ncbi:MAG: transcriptional repressor LexA [Caldilineales bacterium]|nr:transcriptional repressor LexA [Caldilineales bacterium]MDW8318831.1 transcriptional repressor LexA [Anaerolineae bacterium]